MSTFSGEPQHTSVASDEVPRSGLSRGVKVLISGLVIALVIVGVQLGLSANRTVSPPSASVSIPLSSGEPVAPTATESGGTTPIAVAATAAPISEYVCPADQPIKGNERKDVGTLLYQVPGGAFYNRTKPEACFRDVAAAVGAGFSAPPGQ